ncbi:SH3 domain-containing protein [Listeria booriae]|uniref:SH3 domain-containing protein n=1 Tax=Listeria booriae TaxID=1552123 RepID=UPI0016263089|nr:SH3 domain-containing protein [Listeria booriae]MBC1811280.1 SH3 domain-containing protein [Listeria booriae]MBC2077844.1 SH3 domain-containing protein [Listeria booriae]
MRRSVKFVILGIISALFISAVFPFQSTSKAAAVNTYYYALNDINLRSKRDFSGNVVVKVPKNDKMTVVDGSQDTNGWVQISYKGKTGYMKLNYMTMLNPKLSYSELYAPSAINLRESRSFSATTVLTIPKNKPLYVEDNTQDTQGWVRIVYAGKTGYMKKMYLADTDPTKTYGEYYAPSVINLRLARTFDSDITYTIPKGKKLLVEDKSTDANGWAKVLYQGKTGFMKMNYFSLTDPSKGYGIYYAPSTINLRSGRSFDTAIIASIPQNSSFNVEDGSADANGWVKIIITGGKVGYMKETYLSTFNPTQNYSEFYSMGGINLRGERNFSSSTVIQIPLKTKLYVENGSRDLDGWVKIAYKGRIGYMKDVYITPKNPSAIYVVKYAASDINLRQSRTYASSTVVTIPSGAKVEVENGSIDANNWVKIIYSGTVGYMNQAYLSNTAYQPIKQNYKTTSYTSTYSSALSKLMDGNPQTDKKPTNAYISEAFIRITGTNTGVALNANGQVRNTASSTGFVLGKLKSAEPITILNTIMDSEGTKWYKFNFNRQWFNASQSDTTYYLNPNNFSKNTPAYLQFLVLSKPTNVDINEVNQKILNGKGILADKGASFNQAAVLSNVNEIYLISHALLESGNGSSQLANGVIVSSVGGLPVTPKKVYNMYGIGAIDSNPLVGGSEYAYKQGWDTPEKAIIGGAAFVAQNYISKGQDTLYKMRFNPANPGVHLYATDIGWALKQTTGMQKLYDQLSSYTQDFDIPKYK